MEQFSAGAPFAIVGTLNLDPAQAKTGPDLGTYASADDKIYQSDDNNVDVIDTKTRTIQKVFTPLSADATTKDIYYDQAHHLLWVGTSDPKVLAIDPDTGKVIYTVKTASGMDQLAADTDDGLLFLGESKAGVMGVVDLATHENIVDVKTESGCHTEGYLPGAGVDDGRGAATGVGSALSSWCLVRPAKHAPCCANAVQAAASWCYTPWRLSTSRICSLETRPPSHRWRTWVRAVSRASRRADASAKTFSHSS
jgi:hypothetical protein